MNEVRLGLWLGILSIISILALNGGCAGLVRQVAHPSNVEPVVSPEQMPATFAHAQLNSNPGSGNQ